VRERKRERERERVYELKQREQLIGTDRYNPTLLLDTESKGTHIYMHIYTYIYIERERERCAVDVEAHTKYYIYNIYICMYDIYGRVLLG
jgi:hypothetical protein